MLQARRRSGRFERIPLNPPQIKSKWTRQEIALAALFFVTAVYLTAILCVHLGNQSALSHSIMGRY